MIASLKREGHGNGGRRLKVFEVRNVMRSGFG